MLTAAQARVRSRANDKTKENTDVFFNFCLLRVEDAVKEGNFCVDAGWTSDKISLDLVVARLVELGYVARVGQTLMHIKW